jgi:hypothetical protein
MCACLALVIAFIEVTHASGNNVVIILNCYVCSGMCSLTN